MITRTQFKGAAIGITVVVGLLFAFAFLTDGGMHQDAVRVQRATTRALAVCPSSVGRLHDLEEAADEWRAHGCDDVPVVVADACDDDPAVGVVQVRGCRDIVQIEGVPNGCPAEVWDLVGVRADGSGHVRLAGDAPSDAVRHVVGHVLRYGHTTRAGSVMHAEPGDGWGGVACR